MKNTTAKKPDEPAGVDGPYTSVKDYYLVGPLKTMNVYNRRGIVIARAINDEKAALIAAALNAYDEQSTGA